MTEPGYTLDPGNGVSSACSMARRRPIRNLEETMDVLVEDIFRYERLAEQAGELESVQEVECRKDILGIINRNDSAILIFVPGVDVHKSDIE